MGRSYRCSIYTSLQGDEVIKLGDFVEIIVYEGITATGKVTFIDNYGDQTHGHLEITGKDGTVSFPWYATDECVRLLTPLEIAMM